MIGFTGLLAVLLATGSAAVPDSSAVPLDSTAVVTLPEVRVDRDRPSAAARRLPTAFVSEVRTGAQVRAVESLSDLLAEVPGVRIVQYGGLGAYSTISLRGTPAGQVGIYVDGSPLTSAAYGEVNVADLPLTTIERVEVYPALTPLAMGMALPGGAVNLVTSRNPDALTARLARGSYNTLEARASGGFRAGKWSGLLHGGYQGADGDFSYFDDNGTDFNAADDSTSIRLNNRFDSAVGFATTAWEATPSLRVEARQSFFHKAQGLPGIDTNPALTPRLTLDRSISQLDLVQSGGGLLGSARLGGALVLEHSRSRDLEGELGLGRHDTDDRLASGAATLDLEWTLPLGLSVGTAGSLRQERAELSDPPSGFPDPPPSERRTAGAVLTLQERLLDERLLLHAGQRWDRIHDELHSTGVAGITTHSSFARELRSPQIGARLALLRDFGVVRELAALANASDASRPPTFAELFGRTGSILGNPGLLPERGKSHDWGGHLEVGATGGARATVDFAHYESVTDELIVYLPGSQRLMRATNIGKARIQGEELKARLGPLLGLSVNAATTWQSTIDEGDAPFWRGKQLPQRADRQSELRLSWRGRQLAASGEVVYIGPNYLDRYNRTSAESRTLTSAGLSWTPPGDHIRFTVEGKNLGDRRAVDVANYPLPGRTFFVSCDLNLRPGSTPVR